MERSSWSRSHGHSRRRRRVSASRRATASATSSGEALTRGPARLALWLRLLLLLLRRVRRRRGLRAVLALGRLVAVAALGQALPLVAELLREGFERLLLVLRGEQLLDRRRRLLERLLRGRGDLVDHEVVVAELRLHRALELTLLGAEDRVVERLLLLALGHRRQLAALVLGLRVDRVLLGDRLPRLAALERLERGRRLRLVLGQNDAHLALLGLGEAPLVLVVVVADLRGADVASALADLVDDLLAQQAEADLEEDVLVGLAGLLEELLVVGVLGEALLLLLVEGLLDARVGHLYAHVLGLAVQPARVDQQLEDLVAQALVLLLALSLQLRVGLLGLALGGLGRGLFLLGDALRVVGRVGHLGRRLAAGAGSHVHPVGELGFVDRVAVDGGHGVSWDAAATHDDAERRHEGAQRQEGSKSLHIGR